MRHVLGLKQWKWQRIGALAAAVCGVGVGLLKGLPSVMLRYLQPLRRRI